MLNELNQDLASSGGAWVKLNRKAHGTLKGIVVDVETREKTFEGAVVLSRKTGKPRQERVFTLITDQRDPEVDDDKGIRKFSANEGAYFAILDALKEAKATAEIGDTLAIKVIKDPETTTSGRLQGSVDEGSRCAGLVPAAAAARRHAGRRDG